ncbi:DUF4883 family protein [Clostridium senegalense]|uniref:DUF4883 family protein n=1 Tax=Clostridium senegalense TaxID=1465809 RepID=UPI0002895397|nr:DUF4883 family protein [Clostridium senegalense]
MYKRLSVIICVIFMSVTLTGCSSDLKFIFKKEKPSINFYTENLINSYIENPPTEVSVFDVNMYKQQTLTEEQSFDVLKFMNSLKKDYALEKDSVDLSDEKITYKVFITFDNCKYVINVYNEKYISIYPWDGNHSKDYMDISQVPIAYNVYGLCKYFTDNSLNKDEEDITDKRENIEKEQPIKEPNESKEEKEGN